ncbi:MAG: hypothetical protein K8S99_14805 [Planctomycetes bacterium]|nr:hypothetical protein [Planctomycetota bacterium]
MKSRTVQILCIFLIIAGTIGASMMVPSINRQRNDLQLNTMSDAAVRTLPPNEALTAAALSVFRGLAVDVLWYRMNRLKEEGSFYEINQISNWLVTLQPRFPAVWSFMAWNMAYNVSVATNTPEERWDWVNKGIRILRERGIPNNPNAIRLYREEAWIFFHKIGQFSDNMNWYYKTRLAREWQEVLGAPPDGATTQEAIARFKVVADAPDTLEHLTASHPLMPRLLDRLRAVGANPDEATLRAIGRIIMFTSSLDAKAMGLSTGALDDKARSVFNIIEDPELAPAIKLYLAYLRKRVITDNYRMDPAYMLTLMQRYGPFDWRHPASHACYWSSLCTDKIAELRKSLDAIRAKAIAEDKDTDLINSHRGVMHALQELMFRGRVSFDPSGGHPPDLLPDPRFIDSYDTALQRAMNEVSGQEGDAKDPTMQFGAGYENFLFTAVVYSYFYGDREQAQKYLDRAQGLFGKLPDRVGQPRYTKALDDVVYEETFRNLDLLYHARQFIDGMMIKAFNEGLMNNRPDVFNRFLGMAERVHKKFNENVRSVPNAPQDPQGLPPFQRMLADGFVNFLQLPQVDALRRFRIWSNTPPDLRRGTYDRFKEVADKAATAAGLDPAKAFPEPEGMDEWRKAHPPAPIQTERHEQSPAALEVK